MAIEILIESQIQPFDNVAEFPATGAEKTIYIAKDINSAYYWNGSAYILIVDPTEVVWGDIGGDLLNQSDLINALNLKVDKVAGKGLSTEDYTTAEKSKLAGIQAGAEVNVNADWNATSGDAEILNKPNLTIYATNSALTSGLATKQDVLGFTPVSTARTLTINGVTQDLSADRTFTIPTGLTIGTTPISSGTIGRVLFEGTGNVLQQSGNLAWNNTNNQFSLLTNSDLASSALSGLSVKNSNSTGYANTLWYNNNDDVGQFMMTGTSGAISGTNIIARQANFINAGGTGGINLLATAGHITFLAGSGSTSKMTFFQTGNLAINTTTDAGFRLDVNGTARVQAAGEVLRVQGTTATGNSYVQYRNSSGNLGYIGWGSSVTDHLNIYNEKNADAIFGTNNIERLRILSGGNVGIGTSTSSSGFSVNARVLSIVDNATSNVGSFRAYGGGTTTSIELFGSVSLVGLYGHTNHPMTFWTNTAERMRIFSTGNIGINTTTDAGFRLDVNGTARFSGGVTLTDSSAGIGGSAQGVSISSSYWTDFFYGGTRTHRLASNQFGLNSFIGNNIAIGYNPTGASPASAKIELGAGTATAGTAPLKLRAGTNLTTPENGAFEYDGTNLYFTVGGVRKTVTLV